MRNQIEKDNNSEIKDWLDMNTEEFVDFIQQEYKDNKTTIEENEMEYWREKLGMDSKFTEYDLNFLSQVFNPKNQNKSKIQDEKLKNSILNKFKVLRTLKVYPIDELMELIPSTTLPEYQEIQGYINKTTMIKNPENSRVKIEKGKPTSRWEVFKANMKDFWSFIKQCFSNRTTAQYHSSNSCQRVGRSQNEFDSSNIIIFNEEINNKQNHTRQGENDNKQNSQNFKAYLRSENPRDGMQRE